MFTELSLPTLPRWATDVSATSEPAEALKDTGAVQGTASAAKEFNWLQNQQYQYCQFALKTVISNWRSLDYASKPTLSRAVIFHPDQGMWLIVDNNVPNSWISYDGHNFTVDAAVGAPEPRSIAIDSTYIMFGLVAGGINTRDITGAYLGVTSVAIGGAGGVDTIITKYPSSDFCMVTRSGVIRIAATGVTSGAWVAATTPPPAPVTTGNQRLLWAGGTTFFLMQGAGGTTKTFMSTDDGDNWAVTTFPWSGIAAGVGTDMAYNPDDDMLVIVGADDTPSGHIEYSLDSGTTWTVATIDYDGTPSDLFYGPAAVYYCGQGMWVAAGTSSITMSKVLVSADGINWSLASMESELDAPIVDIHASSRMLVAVGSVGVTASLGTGAE